MLQLNTNSLYGIMRDFYTLTRIRIVIFDASFQELLAYPPQRESFCDALRASASADDACRSSDKSGCLRCARTKSLVRYQCHAGLTESVGPILDQQTVLAYVMFGQVIPRENRDAALARIRNAFPQHEALARQIPVRSLEELDAAGSILQAITSFVMINRWLTPGKSEFINQLDRFIADNLNRSITAEDVCAAFHMGRTKLYELSVGYLGCGLAEYIRTQRIAQAKKLLLSTDTPISAVADAVGFSDYNRFSRVFKKTVGVSARQYRNSRGQI